MNRNDRPIGVFDSGIGGLTVLKEIMRELPDERTVYLGDTARVPYGIRSGETVKRYSLEMAGFLVEKGIKLLVVACNTASAFAMHAINERFDIPVVGVIEPGARKAMRTTRSKKIGIIGTEGTIKSNSYVNAINALYGNKPVVIREHGVKHLNRYFEISLDDLTIFTKACPLFVSLVEEGWLSNDVAVLTTQHYLEGLKQESIDTLVLGCTHYPLLKDVISMVIGKDVALIDSAVETAGEIRNMMMKADMLRTDKGDIKREFFVTDSPERFASVGGRFLGEKIDSIRKIEIETEI